MAAPVKDTIVYLVTSAPGGVDGRDHTDKGGTLLLATLDRAEAERRVGKDCRYILTPTVVDFAAARHRALAKLDKLDKLVLNLEVK